jgi:ParB family transcriptional regulator, chromosome partitioning protein
MLRTDRGTEHRTEHIVTSTATTTTAPGIDLPDGVEFVWMDPADLIIDANIRTTIDIDATFRASIREHGVKVPVNAVRCADGVHVREGQRRTITATEENIPGIPVYIVPDGGDVERNRIS